MSIYVKIYTETEDTNGVMTIYQNLMSTQPTNINIYTYPKTDTFGIDMSLILIEVTGGNPLKDATTLLFNTIKVLAPNQHEIAQIFDNNELKYYREPATMKIITSAGELNESVVKIHERFALVKEEKTRKEADKLESYELND